MAESSVPRPDWTALRTSAATTRYLTPTDAGEMLGVTPRTLIEWRRKGRGPRYIRIGGPMGRVRYDVRELERFMAEREHDHTTAERAPTCRAERMRPCDHCPHAAEREAYLSRLVEIEKLIDSIDFDALPKVEAKALRAITDETMARMRESFRLFQAAWGSPKGETPE